MKHRVAAFFIWLCLPLFFHAADYTVLQTVFVPPRFFVGDSVDLRIRLRISRDASISVPEVFPDSTWVEFRDMMIIDRGEEKEVRISFLSYYPGTQTLPPLPLGDIELHDVKIHTDSLLAGGREEYRGPRSQVLLPGTRLYFALAALGAVGGAAFSVFFFRFGKKRLVSITASYRSRIPYRKLRKVMKRLKADNLRLDARSFFIILLDELRHFISGSLGRDCRSATTQEVGEYLSKVSGEGGKGYGETILELFRHGDLVKFGHLPSSPEIRSALLGRLQSAVGLMEKERRKKEGEHVDP